MKSIELTTMCAILDETEQKVLCINRTGNWPGWAFPGGHLENSECYMNCVQREIEEETGIKLSTMRFKGIANIFNTETEDRHIIMNYLSHYNEGNVKARCNEGEIAWINRDDLEIIPLAEGMNLRFPIFFEPGTKELYIEWDSSRGYTKVQLFDM